MPLASKTEAEAGTVETGLMTPLRTKQAIDALVPTMTGATDEDDGAKGLVPAPSAGDEAKFLTGAGTFSAIPTMTGATDEDDGAEGLVPAPSAGDEAKFLAGDGTWKNQPPLALAETEFYTRKVWIDDRPIFCAIVNFGALPNGTEKRVASGVPSGATVIRIKGYSKDVTDVVATIPLPYSSVQVYHNDATQELVITTASDMTAFTETYIVLEYVKEA